MKRYLPIGHRLAANDVLGPGDLHGELLFAFPARPTRGSTAGLGFRGVRETTGDVGRLVVARRFAPAPCMPDTLFAWRQGPPAELALVIDAAREAAREPRG